MPSSAIYPSYPLTQWVSSLSSSSGRDDGRFLLAYHEHHRNARTRGPFRPRNSNKGTTSYQLRQFAEATLGSGSLRKAVKLPEGEDLNEWLAVNGEEWVFCRCMRVSGYEGYMADEGMNGTTVVDFYNQINLLYGSITEFCSPQSCPEMKATDE